MMAPPSTPVDQSRAAALQAWLAGLGLEKYATAFASQDVGLDVLPDLTDADLRELGVVSLGDRKRLLKAAAQAPAAPGGPAEPGPAVPPATPSGTLDDEGERRHATVMFSDLTGYTALNEAFDPEEVEALMAGIRQQAVQVIEGHGGRVNQFVGDEVMALFGIPLAHRDDPRRAVAAALELHRVVDSMAAEHAQRLGRRLALHTGVHTGLVIARRSDSRSGDFMLTGDTVNTAARLRGLAEPGEVVVSPQTWQQVADHFDAVAGQAVEVKGKERPLVPYRVLAQRDTPRAGNRPLVGRADEVARFTALARACADHAQGHLVLVRGDPGMGKSRLVAEFLHLAREMGFTCHATAVPDFGARTGHEALRRLAQSLLGLPPDADQASRGEALQALGRSLPEGVQHAAFLYDLLDVAAPADVLALLSAMEASELQEQSLEALRALVRSPRSGAPILLAVEDIHWADAWTLQQLAALAACTTRQPVLLLLSTRFAGDPISAEWRAPIRGLAFAAINLGPLATEDAVRLAAGASGIPSDRILSCVERAEGNPLFLEQLLLNAGNEDVTSLPGSVQALVQARMDRLQPTDKAALQAAAVWGPRVPLAAIRHLLADPDYDAQPLVDQFLLHPDDDALVFNHALVRDGAYASLLLSRRRQLHALAAEWVEPRDAALAGEHFERAEDPRATGAYLRAARDLAVQFQHAQAQALIDRAARLASAPEHQFPVRLARARLLLETGRAAESIDACRTALEVAQSGAQRALGLITMAGGMRILDRFAEGMELLKEAQPLAVEAGLTLERSRLHHLRGNLLFSFGRTTECLQEHEAALRLARAAGSSEAEAAALGGVGDACYAEGRVRTGYEMFNRCVMVARVQLFLRVEVAYLPMLGWCSLYLMDVPASLQASRRTIELAVRTGNRRGELMARVQLGMVDGWVCGHWREGRAEIERAMELARALGSLRFQANATYMLGLMAIRAGDHPVARGLLHQALKMAEQGSRSFMGAQLYGSLARIEPDPAQRRHYLALGERALEGAVSHNFFIFCECAIHASLQARAWEEAERYCDRLAGYSAKEPFPWADFIIARGRALARVGRGETGEALLATVESLHRQAQTSHGDLYEPALAQALEQLRQAG